MTMDLYRRRRIDAHIDMTPMIDTLLPSSVIAGAVETIPFEVQGENFVAGSGNTASVILLNGSPRAITCPTATVCTMALNPAAALSAFCAEPAGALLWARAKADPPDWTEMAISKSASTGLERAFRVHISEARPSSRTHHNAVLPVFEDGKFHGRISSPGFSFHSSRQYGEPSYHFAPKQFAEPNRCRTDALCKFTGCTIKIGRNRRAGPQWAN